MHILTKHPMQTRRRRCLRPTLDQLDDRCLPSGLTPAQVTGAYGLNKIAFSTPTGPVKGDGSGQTIALIEAYHDPTIASDLETFSRTFGLPPAQLNVANQAGGVTNSGWGLEESLDVEWAHAIAPGATLLVVEARSQSRDSLIRAVNSARNTPGVVAISMSWGFNEFAREAAYNSYFTAPAGQGGITFVAASGDSGPFGAEWPAVSPNVLAVGGTSLHIGPSGGYQFEAAWNDSSGGYGRFQGEPGYQRLVQASGKRSTPDVAFDGDPSTGVAVYQTSLGTGQGSWVTVGGTSLGTPAWAAIIAIVDQGRNLSGQGSLNGPTQALPALYRLPAADFHVIAPLPRFGRAIAGGSANTSTGRGTPVGPSLIADLVASQVNAPLSISQARPSTRQVARFQRRMKKRAVQTHTISAFAMRPGIREHRELARHAKSPSPQFEAFSG
jgi:hypothetical protein